jgi:RNA polymerase sigma-70 factor (ECF subfamily)
MEENRGLHRIVTHAGMENPRASVQERIVEALPRLRRFARTLARDPHDADDLVQVVLERALARIAQWRSDSSLAAWLFGIMKNAWIDERRARGRRESVLLPAELGENVGRATTDAAVEGWALQEAMQQLPDEQRIAIALVLVEGMSYKEAAAVLDVPMGTVTSRLARGRAALEKLLGDKQ